MVSPHSKWEDQEWGFTAEIGDDFTSEEVRITVMPVRARFSGGSALVQSVERGSENGYSIVVEVGTPGYGTHDDIITFGDERLAWEFAHLLTHYLVHDGSPALAVGNLTHNDPTLTTEKQWVPNRLIEDLSAVETFEKLLSPTPLPVGMADVLE
ncbi:hypothetical protein [Halocatena marina]|uniref:hypothetical protein n=1 Tax=Halocatena marina TaxID=2934937 RepID=UPI002010BEA7|nr:hypothetical protein [Halocatena marina]